MTYVVSLTDPHLAFFHEQGLARAGMTPETKTGYVTSNFDAFKDRVRTEGPPKLIICDYDFLDALEDAARINRSLQQVPVVVIFGGNHALLSETPLNRVHTVDVVNQSPRDILRIVEASHAAREPGNSTVTPAAFQAALREVPLLPGGDAKAGIGRQIRDQPRA